MILALINNWESTGSVDETVQCWAGLQVRAVSMQGFHETLASMRALPQLHALAKSCAASAAKIIGMAQVHEDFFSKPAPMQLYKNSVQKIIGRVNTISGRMYRDDPTIMAWCALWLRHALSAAIQHVAHCWRVTSP